MNSHVGSLARFRNKQTLSIDPFSSKSDLKKRAVSMLTWDSNKQTNMWNTEQIQSKSLPVSQDNVRHFLFIVETKSPLFSLKKTSWNTLPARTKNPFTFIKGLAFWPPCTWNQDIELQGVKSECISHESAPEAQRPQDTRQGQWHFKHGLMEALHTWIHRWTWHLTQVIPVWEDRPQPLRWQ